MVDDAVSQGVLGTDDGEVDAALAGEGDETVEVVGLEIDGLTYEFETWRFNVRSSNTEPLLRLNVETRGDAALLADKTDQQIEDIAAF